MGLARHLLLLLWTLVFAICMGVSESVRADDGFFGIESKRVSLNYLSYTGDENKSLTGNSGFGLEAGIGRGNRFLQLLTKLRLEYSTGTSKFLDSGTQLNLSYRMIGANAAFGFRINPVMSEKETGFGIYLGAVGTFGVAQLTLPNRTYTDLKTGQTGTAIGYDLFAGAEFGSALKTRMFIEVGLKTARSNLGNNSTFQLDGLILQGGLTW